MNDKYRQNVTQSLDMLLLLVVELFHCGTQVSKRTRQHCTQQRDNKQ